MHGNTLVAVYGSRSQAERARDSLVQVGVPQNEIRLSDEGSAPSQPGSERREGLWDWLFGSDIPQSDRSWYQTNLREGRTAVSVFVRNEAERERLIDTLDESGPIDFEGTDQGVTPDLEAGRAAAGATQMTREGEQVIPVVKEELDVGKRATERSYRVHAYVVEKPVEEQVNLRDERVIVEHRPAAGEQTLSTPEERELEVIERHEEPVVGKRARKTEDVVVRKEANERTENVQDTVRETRVDVNKEQARGADPLNRRR